MTVSRHLLLALFLFSAPAPAQISPATSPGTFDLDKSGQRIALLDGLWRFHVGDDGAWANPDFDDSSWALIDPAEDHPGKPTSQIFYSGTAWYRARIRIPAGAGPLSLEVIRTSTNYQIFADGQLVTTMGGMAPHPNAYHVPRQVFALPGPNPNQAHTLTIAIRAWNWPAWQGDPSNGPADGLRLGDSKLIQRDMELQNDHAAWSWVSLIILTILEGLAGLAALALFAVRRGEPEYFWFAAHLLASVIYWCSLIYIQFHIFDITAYEAAFPLSVICRSLTEIGFYYCLLDGKRSWLFWSAIVAGMGPISVSIADCFLARQSAHISAGAVTAINLLSILPGLVWIVQLVIRRAVQGFPDARLLLVPVLFFKAVTLLSTGLYAITNLGWYHGSTDWLEHTVQRPFDAGLEIIGLAFFLIAMLAILIYRFTRTRLHEETYEREREAARTVQQLLIPAELPPIPGYEIAAVYQPASEVSGDFFQVIPLASNSVLIAIGDVSGKGLPAALMVSLLVGTLRTYAETLSSPAQILAGLNRRVHGRSGGGFTTCLILRAGPDGALTLANAGHLSPYTDGQEIPVQSGLPLGILPEAGYEETTFCLAPNQSVTLLTDGVIEARNPTGELFGFDRTQSISRHSPAEIAQAAQSHGQDDDITVLQLTRLSP
jgi:sigma-B regulation protein RsbU (phosphoserine phosphatase)